MKRKNYLDLTNKEWKTKKRWHHVGREITRSKLTKPEKIARAAAVINIAIPATAWPITSPIIIKIGQRFSRHKRVRFREGR